MVSYEQADTSEAKYKTESLCPSIPPFILFGQQCSAFVSSHLMAAQLSSCSTTANENSGTVHVQLPFLDDSGWVSNATCMMAVL